jgi:hypothetical protein
LIIDGYFPWSQPKPALNSVPMMKAYQKSLLPRMCLATAVLSNVLLSLCSTHSVVGSGDKK